MQRGPCSSNRQGHVRAAAKGLTYILQHLPKNVHMFEDSLNFLAATVSYKYICKYR